MSIEVLEKEEDKFKWCPYKPDTFCQEPEGCFNCQIYLEPLCNELLPYPKEEK